MAAITNIAAYRFAPLADLKPLRERLKTFCLARNLKGSILLATEGVNLFVAGQAEHVEALLLELRSLPGLESLEAKFSESEEQPFTRMLVKIKKEIIAFGVDGVDPVRDPAPRISAHELKRWLDEGRPFELLDTRNEFEIDLGTFRNARRAGVAHFRDFPAAVEMLPEEMKQKPIVTFCTGGIRCEKAAPYLRSKGFTNVLQLDGGILKYFEEVGRDHYEGECFVFDKRVGLDPELHATGRALCFACQAPLAPADLVDARYVEGVSCPHCHRSLVDRKATAMAERQSALVRAVNPLPGSVPYRNERPLVVSGRYDGRAVIDFLVAILPQYPRSTWLAECAAGNVRDASGHVVMSDRIVRSGERFVHVQPLAAEPDVNAAIRLLYEDDALIVVDKPAPLPVHPCGRFNRNTLQEILRTVYAPQKPRPAHRLDANTTGVTVFTREARYSGFVQKQFEAGTVEKLYLARVLGHPPWDAMICDAPIRETPGPAGARDVSSDGLQARTELRTLERRADGTALVEAVPRTGRTNQIRIHLWHLGFPIMGDPMYRPKRAIGETQTLAVGDPPLCLHARRLSFLHPLTRQRSTFEADPPAWAS
ncbi:MAG: pseudouridine synthase [Planctomycetia bacterium]|nr:pseudouridine synthase [Planctomycetia bacterium]